MDEQSQQTNTQEPTQPDSIAQDEAAVGQLITPQDATSTSDNSNAKASDDTAKVTVSPIGSVPADDSGMTTEEVKPAITGSPGGLLTDSAPTDTVKVSPAVVSPAPSAAPEATEDKELLSVKQQALEQLTPLVDKLDVPAEEKFNTYMMIIRASDDPKLIKPAFESAQAIAEDDKKAQALLDVVNEINYLTQPDGDKPENDKTPTS